MRVWMNDSWDDVDVVRIVNVYRGTASTSVEHKKSDGRQIPSSSTQVHGGKDGDGY